MSKSTGRSFGRGRGSSGTLTVIEARVHNASARNAKLAFYLTLVVVTLLAATVAADRMHPILALFFGFALGALSAACVWAIVRIWPVIRLLWWWTPEILLAFGLVSGWTVLARHTVMPVRLLVVVLVVGVPAALPFLRRRLVALAWCLIVRHRVRTCFAQFIIANRAGSLPLILWTRPTPVGERVWVYLRTGLALPDLQSRLDKIAVACWASNVIAERASDGNAAYVRLDIKRRNVLNRTVGSPLVDLVDPNAPKVADTTEVPTALDLPDVPSTPGPATVRVLRPEPARKAAATAARPAVAGANGGDVTDWID